MTNRTKRAALTLSDSRRKRLERLSRSQTAPVRETRRAKVLLHYADGLGVTAIQQSTGLSRPTIYKCIDKALGAGAEAGLKDLHHSPKAPEIDADARAWLISIACRQPKQLGLAAELWSVRSLTRYVAGRARAAGHPRLSSVSPATVHRILNARELKPHRVRYYLERRDPDFEAKMREVLMVYRDVLLKRPPDELPVHSVSVDEKPGVQAIATLGPDLPPRPDEHASVARDAEYRRLGTLTILASLDLHTGEVLARVEARHRSREFIALLRQLDDHYPSAARIRVVLDNHSAHVSKETLAYLATRPNRFEYVHTPKHGSWLNLIETVFSRMARTFLREIRVSSIEELKSRIEAGIREMNEEPVQVRWGYFDPLDETRDQM